MITKSENTSFEECLELLKDSYIRQSWLDRMRASIRDIWVYEYFDDNTDERLAFGMIIRHFAGSEFARLMQLYVDESSRNKGIGSLVLDYIINDLRVNAITYLNSYIVTGQECSDLYLKYGFFLKRKETNMIYDGDTILNSKISSLRDKLAPVIDRVCGIDDLTMEEKRDFNNRIQKRGVDIDVRKTDDTLTRYYIVDGKVAAYMAFRKDESKDFIMSDFYGDSQIADKYAIPAMIESLVQDHEDEITGHDMMLDFTSEKHVAAMKQGFGEPRVTVETDAYLLRIE